MEPNGRGRVPRGRVAAALLALALFALLVAPALDRGGRPGAPTAARVAEIAGDPPAFYDREVAVGGEVGDLVDAHAFTLVEAGAGARDAGRPVVLVLTRDPVPRAGGPLRRRAITPGDQLQVSGPVRAFDLPRIEAELGVDLRDAAFGVWAARPAIVATALALLVGPGAADARALAATTGAPARCACVEGRPDRALRGAGVPAGGRAAAAGDTPPRSAPWALPGRLVWSAWRRGAGRTRCARARRLPSHLGGRGPAAREPARLARSLTFVDRCLPGH